MAMRVMNLPLQVVGVALTRVTLPVMSQVNRSSPERMGEIYLRMVRLAGVIILPGFLLVIVLREPLVAVMLGPTWAEIVPIIAFLCAAGLLTNFNYFNGSTLLSMGDSNARFRFSIVRALVGSVLLVLATPFGTLAAAAVLLLRGVVVEPLVLLYLLERLHLSRAQYLRQMQGSALAALVLVAVWMGLIALCDALPQFVVLVLAGTGALLAYGATVFIVDKPLTVELRGLGKKRGQVQ